MKRRTLIEIYDEFNSTIFADLLVRPEFRITRARGEYASYQEGLSVPSTIHFNARAIKGHWARSIVYHEMIHQYVAEFLGIEEYDHHGPVFWKNYRKFAPNNVILFEGL